MRPPNPYAEDTIAEEIPLLRRISAVRLFALVAGALLTIEGLLAFVPAFSQGGMLFDLPQVDWRGNLVHLAMGLLGLAIWQLRLRSWEMPYAIVSLALYSLLFIFGEVKVERAANGPASVYGQDTLLGWLMAVNIPTNALHLGFALLAFLAILLAAFQIGARATRRAEALGETHHTNTPLPSA